MEPVDSRGFSVCLGVFKALERYSLCTTRIELIAFIQDEICGCGLVRLALLQDWIAQHDPMESSQHKEELRWQN